MSLYRDRGVVLRTYKLGEADRIVVLRHGRPRQGAGGGQGRPPHQEPHRRAARTAEPRRAADVRGPRARHREPGRDDRAVAPAARGPHLPRPGPGHGRGHRAGGPGAGAIECPVPHAGRGVAHLGQPARPLVVAVVLLEVAFPRRCRARCSTAAPAAGRARRRPPSSLSTSPKEVRSAGTAGGATRSARPPSNC